MTPNYMTLWKRQNFGDHKMMGHWLPGVQG